MRVALLIDLPADHRYHVATVDALRHAAGDELDLLVQHTDAGFAIDDVDGVVIGPGSPYRDEAHVEGVIRAARERGVPLVGT